MREFDAAAAALSEAMEKIEQKPPETESEPPPARPRRRGRVKGILA